MHNQLDNNPRDLSPVPLAGSRKYAEVTPEKAIHRVLNDSEAIISPEKRRALEINQLVLQCIKNRTFASLGLTMLEEMQHALAYARNQVVGKVSTSAVENSDNQAYLDNLAAGLEI